MPVLKDLSERKGLAAVDFTVVYIAEAHAYDEWPISSARDNPSGDVVSVEQPKTIEERLDAARAFAATFGLANHRVFVDAMDDLFDAAFSAWPFRYFVLDGNEARLVGMPEADGDCDKFSSKPLQKFLRRLDNSYSAPKRVGTHSMALMLHYTSGRRGYEDRLID